MSVESKIGIEIFKNVTKAIAESDNLEIMCNHLAHLMVTTLSIKGCAIFVLNPDNEELEMLASFGLSTQYLAKGTIHAPKSIAETLKGKPVIIPDISKEKNIQYPVEAKNEGIAAIISIPIIFLNENIGALRLYHSEIWDVSIQDLDSLKALADNIGLAMAYTRLYNAIYSILEIIGHSLPKELLTEFSKK